MAARSLQAWSQTVTNMQIGKLNSRTLRRRSYTITYNKLKLPPMIDHDRRSSKKEFQASRKAIYKEGSKI